MMYVSLNDIVEEKGENYHGGSGSFTRKTLLENVPGSSIRYVRDIHVTAGTVIGLHPHYDDEEIYFIVSGEAKMIVDGEEKIVGAGSFILTLPGSTHGIENIGQGDLHLMVVCTENCGVKMKNEANN